MASGGGSSRSTGVRQGEHTRARLLEAGMRVLAERGVHAARVDDVVRVADVSHGTFYLYFANKEDLFRALAVRCAQDMSDLAGSLDPVDRGEAGREELVRWLGEFVASYRRYGAVIRSWTEDQVSDRELAKLGRSTFETVAGSLAARLREARRLSAADARLEAVALLAMVERFTYFVTSRGLPSQDDESVRTLAAIAHRGFFAG